MRGVTGVGVKSRERVSTDSDMGVPDPVPTAFKRNKKAIAQSKEVLAELARRQCGRDALGNIYTDGLRVLGVCRSIEWGS